MQQATRYLCYILSQVITLLKLHYQKYVVLTRNSFSGNYKNTYGVDSIQDITSYQFKLNGLLFGDN